MYYMYVLTILFKLYCTAYDSCYNDDDVRSIRYSQAPRTRVEKCYWLITSSYAKNGAAVPLILNGIKYLYGTTA